MERNHKIKIIKVSIIVIVVISGLIYCLKGLCQVHHIPLLPDRVDITYGLVTFTFDSNDYSEASIKYFPNAKTIALGGCVVLPDSPKTTIAFYCPKCRKAELNWIIRHEDISTTESQLDQEL